MSPLVQNYIEIQKLGELELQEQVAGASSVPNYLVSEAVNMAEVEISDSASLSGPPLANTQANAALQSSILQVAEEEQYVENSLEYQEMIERKSEDPPPPPPPPASDASSEAEEVNNPTNTSSVSGTLTTDGSGGDAFDAINDYDSDLNEDVWNVEDDSFYYRDENGYLVVDEEKLEAWEKRMITRTNVLASLLIALSSKFDARRVAEEAFTGISQPEDKNSYKQTFARKVRTLQKIMQQVISKLFEYINTENQKIYNERIEKCKANRDWDSWDGFWNNVEDWISGEVSKDEARAQLEETHKYLEATKAAMEAMRKAISAVIELLKVSFVGGDMSMVGVQMITSFVSFNNKIEKITAEVDKNLQEVMDQLKELEDKGFWESLGDFFVGLFTLDFNKMFGSLKRMTEIIADYMGPMGWVLKPIEWGCELGMGATRVAFALVKFALDLIVDYVLPALEYLNPFFYIIQGSRGKAPGWSAAQEFAKWDIPGLVVQGVKYLLEGYQRLMNKINEWLDKLGNWEVFFGPSFFPIRMLDTRGYSFADAAEYVDDLDILQMIADFRGALVASGNAYRAYLAVSLMKHDLRNIALQKFTERMGVKSDAELLMASAESVLGHATQVFDAMASQLMLKTYLHNTTVQMVKGYQQLCNAQAFKIVSTVLSLVAVVAGLVGLFFPPALAVCAVIALVAGVVAGLAGAMAVKMINSIPAYTPVEASYTTQEEKGTGKTAVDVVNNIEIQEKINLQAMAYAKGMIGKTADGFYYFNSKAFAAYEMQQKILDNILRSVFSVLKNSRDLRRVVDAEFTGTSSPDSGDALLQNMVENNIMQRAMLTQAIKFQHMEVINARNLVRSAEIAKEKADLQAVISVGAAVAGAFIGWLIGPGIWAIMSGIFSAIGNAVYSIVEAATDDARGMDLNIECPELDRMLREKGEDSTEARLDDAELRVYNEILANGIVATGNGYHGVDFGFVTQAYARLGKIYAVKEALAKARALSSQLRQIVKQEFTGTTLGTVGELTDSVNRASFNVAMKTLGNLVRFLQEKAKVMNRAADAEKQFKVALATGVVNIALSAAGGVCVGVSASTTVSAVTSVTLRAVAGVLTSLTSLVSSLASLITSIKAYNSDYGAYNNYNAKTTVDQTGKKVSNPRDIDDKLDKLEYEIMTSMTADLVQTLDGSNWAVSPLAARLNSRMRALFNLREALAIARSILSESKATAKSVMAGKSLRASDAGQDSIGMFKEVSMAMLGSLKQALETLVERHNQIEQAKKNIVLSCISTAASLVSIGLSISATVKDVKAKHLYIQGQTRDGSVVAPRVNAPSPDMPPSSVAPSANARTISPSASSNATSPTSDALSQTASSSGEEVTPDSLGREAKTLNKVATICGLVSRFINIVTDISYDAGYNENKKNANSLSNTQSLDVKQSSLTGKGGAVSSLDSMDAAIDEAEYELSVLENREAAQRLIAARGDRVLKYLVNEIKSLDETVKSLHEKKITSYLDVDRNSQAAGAAAQQPRVQNSTAGIPTPRTEENQNTTPSSRALLDYADQIEQQVQARLNNFTQQVEQLENKASELNSQIEVFTQGQRPVENPEEILENLKAQRDALVAEKNRLMQERQQLQQNLQKMKQEELPALRSAAQTELDQVKTRMTEISTQIEGLEAREALTPEQQAQLETLRNERQMLQSQRNALESALGLVDEKMAEVEQKLNALKTRSDELFQRINDLNQQIQQVQRQIASVQRQIETGHGQGILLASAVAASASAKGGPSIFEGVGRMFRSLFGSSENSEGVSSAGGLSADPNAGKVIVAVRNAGGRGEGSFREQYERAQAEEELYLRHMSGVAC